ncbi:MAG: LysR family transcriptional regulator [Oscillospiraceae bacterium]|nr:LysR family transcriptional regulator [Oscillospiraceae bacterium]
MEIQQLRYFVKIAECSNFTRAAEELYVTQPMLTRAIKTLEDDLGTKLIERTSKYFCLTDAGRLLFQQASDMLHKYDDIYRSIDDVKTIRKGHVKMSIPGVLIDVYFAPLLARFGKEYPGIDISIIEEGSKDTVKSVISGKADLGLAMMPIESASEMNINLVISDKAYVLMSKMHPLSKYDIIPIEELKDQPIITFGDTSTLHDEIMKICSQCGFKPNMPYKTLMTNFIFQMVSMGRYVAILPRPVIEHFITDDLTSRPTDPSIKWEIALMENRNRYCSHAANHFITFLRNYFDELTSMEKVIR